VAGCGWYLVVGADDGILACGDAEQTDVLDAVESATGRRIETEKVRERGEGRKLILSV